MLVAATIIKSCMNVSISLPQGMWLETGGHLNIKIHHLASIGIPMLKIRRSHDCLIFNMEIPIPGKESLYIETGPGYDLSMLESKETQMCQSWNIVAAWITGWELYNEYLGHLWIIVVQVSYERHITNPYSTLEWKLIIARCNMNLLHIII